MPRHLPRLRTIPLLTGPGGRGRMRRGERGPAPLKAPLCVLTERVCSRLGEGSRGRGPHRAAQRTVEEEEEEAWHMGAADEGCSGHAGNAEHSPEGREPSQGSAPAGDPDPAVLGRRGTRSCFVPPRPGRGLQPAQWDGRALPPSHRPPRRAMDVGRGSFQPQTVGAPSALGPCRHSLCWRTERDRADPQPLVLLLQSPLALGMSSCHCRIPPGPPRVTACLPPAPSLPAAQLEVVCIALLQLLHSLLPAGIKRCRRTIETHRPPATGGPGLAGCPKAAPSLPLCHPPATSPLEEG